MRNSARHRQPDRIEQLISSTEVLNAAVQELLDSVEELLATMGSQDDDDLDECDRSEVVNDDEMH